jgi:hypothetical protein
MRPYEHAPRYKELVQHVDHARLEVELSGASLQWLYGAIPPWGTNGTRNLFQGVGIRREIKGGTHGPREECTTGGHYAEGAA